MMANYGNGFWTVGASITNTRSLPWSPEEDAALGKAFMELDLDGPPLHEWCRQNSVLRSPGAIDARLAALNFFDVRSLQKKIESHAHRDKRGFVNLRPVHELRRELADRRLKNEIAIAKLEAATAPLYKNREAWESL